MPDPRGLRGARLSRGTWWAWSVGIVLGIVALGPALGSGSLLNLDLITSAKVPVPAGAWGLGPELPRRVPLYVPIAWASSLVGGDLLVKGLMVAIVALAVVGVDRLLASLPAPIRLGTGALYALSPFLLTRLEVGHLTIALASALLPWALPVLLAPGRSGVRTLRWAAALGLAGAHGGVLVVIVVSIGLLVHRGRRAGVAVLAVIVGQLPWVVPGIVVWRQGSSLAGAASFPTTLDRPADVLGLLAGHGFWQPALQLGWSSWWAAPCLGAIAIAMAGVGWASMPRQWKLPMSIMAGIGAVVAMAGSLPGLAGPWEQLTDTAPGAALREGQRLLPLVLLPMHLAVAHGAARMGRWWGGARGDLVQLAPAALALLAAAPALWGLGGALTPVRWPSEWTDARTAVAAEPGTVAVLPWHLYLDVSWAGGRRLLNPVPLWLGGDVLTSSDPELGDGVAERGDPREPTMAGLARRSATGHSISDDLARLGVRWVVVLHEADWADHRALRLDPGMRTVVDGPTLELLEVRGWPGQAVDRAGQAVAYESIAGPVARLADGPAAVVHRGGGWGWRRGTESTATDEHGLLVAQSGEGPLWYPPAMVVLVADAVTAATLGATLRTRQRRSEPSSAKGH